jgi:hypothetical protein
MTKSNQTGPEWTHTLVDNPHVSIIEMWEYWPNSEWRWHIAHCVPAPSEEYWSWSVSFQGGDYKRWLGSDSGSLGGVCLSEADAKETCERVWPMLYELWVSTRPNTLAARAVISPQIGSSGAANSPLAHPVTTTGVGMTNVPSSLQRSPPRGTQKLQPTTLTLEEVLQGAERAQQRVSTWPEWKRELSASPPKVTKLKGDQSEAAGIYFVVTAATKAGYLPPEELIAWRKGLVTDRIMLTRVRDRIVEEFQTETDKPKIPAWAINKGLLRLRDKYGSLE